MITVCYGCEIQCLQWGLFEEKSFMNYNLGKFLDDSYVICNLKVKEVLKFHILLKYANGQKLRGGRKTEYKQAREFPQKS
jgi:hypothetical protein